MNNSSCIKTQNKLFNFTFFCTKHGVQLYTMLIKWEFVTLSLRQSSYQVYSRKTPVSYQLGMVMPLTYTEIINRARHHKPGKWKNS